MKYSKPKNFLLIVKDNIGCAVCTSGKYMAYRKGKIAKDFFGRGINFNKDDYYIHKNSHDFEEEKLLEKLSEQEEEAVDSVKNTEPKYTIRRRKNP